MLHSSPLFDFERVSTLTLATSGLDSRLHATPVYFVAMETPLRLYFFSDPKSRHAAHLLNNSQVAAALYPECQGWQDIRGLQIHGSVYHVEAGPEWEQAWQAYRAKFPFVAQLKAVVARNILYALKPTWMRLVDNRIAFGHKQEWTLNDDEDRERRRETK